MSEGRHEAGGVDGASTLLLEIIILNSFFFLQLEKEELLKKKPLDLTVLRFESRVLEQVLGFREFHQGHSSKSIEV